MDYEKIRELASGSHKPLIFFDDDADGVSSFLMLYRFIGEGKGVIIKTTPRMDSKFIHKVDEFSPDMVFVLDIAEMTEEFRDEISQQIVWVDHHDVSTIKGTKYFNPNSEGKYAPTSYMIYKALKNELWLGMCGCIGDWFIPDFAKEFADQYPDLFSESIKRPDEALFTTKIGLLAKVFSFVTKGTTQQAMTCVKILTRISSPYEILEQTTTQGKYIWKRFEKINKDYTALLEAAKATDDKVLVYTYAGNKMSFTSDLSNELMFRYPDKIIIVGRQKNGELKLSFRSGDIEILPIIQKAMEGLDAFCGGHPNACGGMVKTDDFDGFISKVKELISQK